MRYLAVMWHDRDVQGVQYCTTKQLLYWLPVGVSITVILQYSSTDSEFSTEYRILGV